MLRTLPRFAALRPLSTAASPSSLPPLSLTPRAVARLVSLRSRAVAEGLPEARSLALRVRVDGGGCSGFRYEFLVERPGAAAAAAAAAAAPAADAAAPAEEADTVIAEGEARVLVDAASLGFLRGATLDWEESMMRSAFVVLSNPNADASCGCKASFSVKPAA